MAEAAMAAGAARAKVELHMGDETQVFGFEQIEIRSLTKEEVVIALSNASGEELVVTLETQSLRPLLSWTMLLSLA